MSKSILFVEYLPHGDLSRTNVLKDAFYNNVQGVPINKNLVEQQPDFFDYDSMAAYVQRNYEGRSINEDGKYALRRIDRAVDEFKHHDVVVICCPMHNFGFPAAVKAWIDNIVIAGETFGKDKDGNTISSPSKQVLVMFTRGGTYDSEKATEDYPYWDALTVHAKIIFKFMGVESIEVVSAGTSNPETNEKQQQEAIHRIKEIIEEWKL